ncbi:MAG TPA: PepSY-associated TM helix domain-containing protein [Gammaproteobacteria bacterium]
MSPRKRRLAEKFRSLYLWHRYAGLAAALLAIWLAATGIVLNHTEDLDLSEAFVQQEWLLGLYNIEAPQHLEGLRAGGHWLTQSGARLYLDANFIGTGHAVDAATTAFGIVVALPHSLRLYLPDATLIEEIPFTASKAPIDGLGTSSDGIVIISGGKRFLADGDFTQFELLSQKAADPATPSRTTSPLPPDLAQRIASDILHHSLTWERVLLDLHAGRIFGKAGAWLADLAGVLLLLLAVSGVMVWVQRTRRRQG